MAGIGNEAKLILKLAAERMECKYDLVRQEEAKEFMRGFHICLATYNTTLMQVVAELES